MGISQGSWKGRAVTPPNGLTPPKDVPSLGGLTDEDLESQRPSSKESKGWNSMRMNEASIFRVSVTFLTQSNKI